MALDKYRPLKTSLHYCFAMSANNDTIFRVIMRFFFPSQISLNLAVRQASPSTYINFHSIVRKPPESITRRAVGIYEVVSFGNKEIKLTASVCMGWAANRRPARVAKGAFSPATHRQTRVNSRVAAA